MFRRTPMKNTALKVLLTAAVLLPLAVYAQPTPGNPTTATVITKAEIEKISGTQQSPLSRFENFRVVGTDDSESILMGISYPSSSLFTPLGTSSTAGAAICEGES